MSEISKVTSRISFSEYEVILQLPANRLSTSNNPHLHTLQASLRQEENSLQDLDHDFAAI